MCADPCCRSLCLEFRSKFRLEREINVNLLMICYRLLKSVHNQHKNITTRQKQVLSPERKTYLKEMFKLLEHLKKQILYINSIIWHTKFQIH